MKIAKWLKLTGLTDREFAERIGVSEMTVSRWRRERLQSSPPAHLMKKVLAETDGAVTPMDFFEQAKGS